MVKVKFMMRIPWIHSGLLWACFLMMGAWGARAQSPQRVADSLRHLLKHTEDGRQRVDLLNELAWEYKISDAEQARALLDRAVQLADSLSYAKGLGQALNNKGVLETIHGGLRTAIEFYAKALAIRDSLDDKKGVASLYNNMGNLYAEMDSFAPAIVHFKRSLAIREVLKDTLRIARVYYNLANTFEAMGDYEVALDYAMRYKEWSSLKTEDYALLNAHTLMGNIYTELGRMADAGRERQAALGMAKGLGDKRELAIAYNNSANHYGDIAERAYKEGRMEEAKTFFAKAIDLHMQTLDLRKKEKDKGGIGDSYNNLGVLFKDYGSYCEARNAQDSAKHCYKKALYFLEEALTIREADEDVLGMIEVYNGMGDVYRRQGNHHEALRYVKKYLDMAKRIGNGKFEMGAYKDLAKTYAAIGDFANAYSFRKKYDELRYLRLDENRTRLNARREAIYGDFKKQMEIKNKELEIERKEADLQRATLIKRALMGGALALSLLAFLLFKQNRLKAKANNALAEKNEIIERERRKSEELLLNILPKRVANELKEKGYTSARRYDNVSVLFTDFMSFTKVAELLSAEDLVALLDECYRAFDEVVARLGAEKIKTIGDAYMCAAGLPEPNVHHAATLVRVGLEMQGIMRRINNRRRGMGLPTLEMRIGIHSGAVVAGVVGSRKFAFDIWGDTVNVAARMEAAGEVGRVNISEVTYSLVKGVFDCAYRGQVEVKNKGKLGMYFVDC